MHTSTLLFVLSSLGAHAIPLLRPSTNDTLARRDGKYSVVNVGGQPRAEVTPIVETITVGSPPQAPVTITITHTLSSSPSSTPSSTPSSIPSSTPPSSWSSGPLPTGVPSGESPILARELNTTSRRYRRSPSANSTEVHDLVARHNGTVPHLNARSNNNTDSLVSRSNSTTILAARGNSTESKIAARGNGTASGLGARSNIVNSRLTARANNTAPTVISRSNSTNSHINARSLKLTDRAVLYLRDALNSTRVHDSNAVVKRSSNGTSLEA
ncbi:hypothetical protein BDV26DRAFT_253112 [Aspergillus bertholletiae]|uniref:Uncharacterized protein n=1 Tax=Aspergillus bertholletiae TaxID=1226010 RepID=A0A5N7BL46_9EURO|nr:hypothetical protein BDV26DRAFT_253112 [Aspergillus bertholletiae]